MLVTENQLDEWVRANTTNAQGVIVELIWRLVAASSPHPLERRFPLGDSLGQHGPDGNLFVDMPDEPFVPNGRSFWEIGTGIKVRDKANSDYNDLVVEIPEEVRREATFVFVTPLSGRRGWEYTWKEKAQATWLKKQRERFDWNDVRIIDGTKLIDWINKFPAVELWLGQKISSLPADQIETSEQHWSVLSSIGEPPPLTQNVFLADRDDACSKLKELFNGNTTQLKLATHYPDQVTDFVSAYIASLETDDRVDLLGRCLIISGLDAWNTIIARREKHILIAETSLDLNSEAGTRLIQKAHRGGHSVIFGGPHGGIPDPTSVTLRTPSSYQIEEALKKSGYSDERARTLALKSGGNLGSLLRCIQNLSSMPEWGESSYAAELAIASILGAWNENSDSDRAVVEIVSGKAYGEWIGKMREIVILPATPLIQRENTWKFIERYTGWYTLGPRLFDAHLELLLTVSNIVLCEKDPQFELPNAERYAAQIHGKVLAHSRLLRNGIAETLALLGSHPKALTSCTIGKAETTAILAVRNILSNANWERWAGLNDLLPLLAEAAPREFLDAVETSLKKDPCPFDEIFAQEIDSFLGRTYMSGLLWALETLAWDPNQLNRVVICLGELAARDPGGRNGNRPANSLTTILLPWLPQTCAPVAKRVAAVKALITEFPEIGWKLILSLLPHSQSYSMRTRRPAWRETIPDNWSENVSLHEYWEQAEIYSDNAISIVKNNQEKLTEIIDHFENLHPSFQKYLLGYLGSDTIKAISEANRQVCWSKLVDLVSKHRRFPDAQWAMPPDQIDEIAAVADKLMPKTHFFQHQRLFSERDFDLFETKGNYHEQAKELDIRRQKAIEDVQTDGGAKAVFDFATSVQSPWRVGIAYGSVANKETDSLVLPVMLESEQKLLSQFAGGFVWSRFRIRGWFWVDEINTSHWSSTEIGLFLSFLPFTQEAWDRSKQLLKENESVYWKKTDANPYHSEANLEYAVDRLTRFGRPVAAIRCIHRMQLEKQQLNVELTVRALMGAIHSTENPNTMDTYEIVEIIKDLQNNSDINPEDLFRIEWAYLPLLDEHHSASPKLLGLRLATEPEFFCEVIRLVFKSRKGERSEEEVPEERKNLATNAYRLLSNWRTPPTFNADGTYNGDALAAWVDAVKKECKETGHLETAMTMLGHALTYVPADPDGLWIHRAAAAVLNAKDADDMRNGFHTELVNSRGVHFVDPTGKPERELAEKYRKQAEAVENAGYNRLATTLRRLSEEYILDAERLASRDQYDD